VEPNYDSDESEVTFKTMERRFARSLRVEKAYSEEGSENLYNKVVNVLWRNFESAILSGAPPLDTIDSHYVT
jgi:hypothetical protein